MEYSHFLWKGSAVALCTILSFSNIYAEAEKAPEAKVAPVETGVSESEEKVYNRALKLLEEKKYDEAYPLLKNIADGSGERYQDASWLLYQQSAAGRYQQLSMQDTFGYLVRAAAPDDAKKRKGNAAAQLEVGFLGLDHLNDSEEKWRLCCQNLQWAAEQGVPDGWLYLGVVYMTSKPPYQDLERALLCLQAAERLKKDSESAMVLGYYYQFYIRNYDESAKWLLIAAERLDKVEKGWGDVSFLCGLTYYGLKDYTQARKYFEHAVKPGSELGDVEMGLAHLFLGNLDYHDLAIAPKPENKVSAFEHFSTAARNYQNHEAAFQLAHCYRLGTGVKADPDASKVWMNFAKMSRDYEQFVFTGERMRNLPLAEKKSTPQEAGEEKLWWSGVVPWFGYLKKDYPALRNELKYVGVDQPFVRAFGFTRWITPPVAEKLRFPGWDFDANAFEDEMKKNLVRTCFGEEGLKNEKFNESPLDINLLTGDGKERAYAVQAHEKALTMFRKVGYKECDTAAAEKVLKEAGLPLKEKEQTLWQVGKDRYLLISGGKDGRHYLFIGKINGKLAAPRYFEFDNVPDNEETAMVHGVLEGDVLSMNKLAVYQLKKQKYEGCVDLLTGAMEKGCAAAAYNLGRLAETEKVKLPQGAAYYFAKAKEIAGSSVLYPGIQRPEIRDRNGGLLVENKFEAVGVNRARTHLQGSAFASPLLGYTQASGWAVENEFGWCGMEAIIDDKKLTETVYMTMDSALQKRLEKVVRKVAEETSPRYISGLVINSKGELIAATQVPYFDQEKRDFVHIKVKPERIMRMGCDFIPAQYLFPVPNAWMNLLGSASDASPESKEKFKFHLPTGVFKAEANGLVPGLTHLVGEKNPKLISGQSTTLVHYLLAYISVAEKKDVPQPVVYGMKKFAPVKPKGAIRWISFYRPADGIVVNALGVIETEDPNEKLYVVVRSVYEERNYHKKLPEAVQKAAAADGDKAEAILRKDGI